MKNSTAAPQDDVQAPAVITADHVQDRELSPVAGSPRGYRRLDGLDWLIQRKAIHRHQLEAGRRLQADYAESQRQGCPQSGSAKVDGRRSWDVPDKAIDASKRTKAALAIIPPELLSMTALFLFPNFEEQPFSLERIAAMVKEDKRSISLGVRAALSLLARHYGG